MPKKKNSKKRIYKKNSFKKNLFLFLLAIGILLIISIIAKKTDTKIQQIAETDPRNAIQIGTFEITKETPTDSPDKPIASKPTSTPMPYSKYCPPDSPKRPDCECLPYEEAQIMCQYPGAFKACATDADCPALPAGCDTEFGVCWDEQPASKCGEICFGKPVIYLYPEKPTFVNVEIKTTGSIFVSDPQIEQLKKPQVGQKREGWKNVLAHPSGLLIYQGKEYKELFYETKVTEEYVPNSGLTLNAKNLKTELDYVLTQLGLLTHERAEFLDFWVPKLLALNSPFIQFSLIQGEYKDRTDKILISPAPDTFIEILAYFKPLDVPFQGPTLLLPNTPPRRTGFTAVEWGGTIDY